MTARSTKGPERPAPDAEPYDDEEEFEQDLAELVERIVRRTRPARGRRAGAAAEETAEEPDEDEAPADTAAAAPTKPETGEEETPGESTAGDAEEAAEDAGDAGDAEDIGDAGATEDGEDGDGGGAPAARRFPVLPVVTGVLAVALAAVSVFAVLQWRSYTGPGSDQAVREKVTERAGLIATTIYNYDYRHVQQYLDAQQKVLTTSTAAQVKKNWSTMTSVITSAQIVYTAKVDRVYVADIHGGAATAIVELDVKMTASKGIETQTGAMVKFALARQHGVWLADGGPALIYSGTTTDTDLKGNPLPSSTAAATASPSPTAR